MEQKVLRVSTLVVVGALFLRLLSGYLPANLFSPTLSSKAASWMIFLQTGRLVRPVDIIFSPRPTEPIAPTEETMPEPTVPEAALPVFSADDAAKLTINSSFSYSADLSALLTKPLTWDLTAEEPTVLIVHSHGTESYTPTGAYQEVSPYHTLDSGHNMLSIGTYIADILEENGITVLHDTAIHDHPSYNASYTNSRKSIETYLARYPSIRLVLDLHRDSIEDENGNQVVQSVFAQGTTFAPLMLVIGTNYGGLEHPDWQENFALALKLQTQLENLCPGICRNINLRSQRFNQDLSSGALLIEIGASGNTQQEALRSAKILAESILSLARGSA